MSSTTRTTIQLAALSILLIEITNMPQICLALRTRNTHLNYEQQNYGLNEDLHNCSQTSQKNSDEAKAEMSRSIAVNHHKNLIERMREIHSNNTNVPSNNQRGDNGAFKILSGPPKPARASDLIFFPGPKVGDIVTAKPCPNGQSFCETVDEYPQHYVKGLLENGVKNYDGIFGIDSLDPNVGIAQRNDFTRTTVMCESDEKVVFPKQALNKENKWMLVVNIPNREQGVRVEICKAENVSCQFADRFPLGYSTTCQQKYIYRKLLALSDVGDPYVDLFRLPSCCSCSIEMPGGISSRFGSDGSANDTYGGPRKHK